MKHNMNDENIRDLAMRNKFFKRVLRTGKYAQIVAMNIPSNESVEEIHADCDEVVHVINGVGICLLNNLVVPINSQDIVFIQAGTRYAIKNTNTKRLHLVIIYSPSIYNDKIVYDLEQSKNYNIQTFPTRLESSIDYDEP